MLTRKCFRISSLGCCLLLNAILGSCHEDKNKDQHFRKTGDSTVTASRDTGSIVKVTDSAGLVILDKDHPFKSFNGRLDAALRSDTISFDIQYGKILKIAMAAVDTKANLRINNIIMPSGKMDGPFGRTADYQLKEYGVYKVLLGRNQMAEGNSRSAYTLSAGVE